MKKIILLSALIAIVTLQIQAQSQAIETIYGVIGANHKYVVQTPNNVNTGTYFYGNKSALIYDNGPMVTHPGIGEEDPSLSVLQSDLDMVTFGTGFQVSEDYRVADDFTITTPCTIDSIAFFGYQTGSTTTSTFTAINLRIWDGIPGDEGSNIIWGDTITNIMSSTSFTNIFRVNISDMESTLRPIMVVYAVTEGLQLNPGTYWLDWQSEGSLASGPWANPITILGETTTGNALQYQNFGWHPIMDIGQQGLPFEIYGEFGAVVTLNDIGVTNLVAPTSGVLTSSETVTIEIENFGTEDEDNFPVFLQINGNDPVSETVTSTIASGTTMSFTFTDFYDFSAEGPITVSAWTALPGDDDTSNDTLTVTINNTVNIFDLTQNSFNVYPNPAIFPVKVSGNEEVIKIQVMDMKGRIIYEDQPYSREFYISFESFKTGMYQLFIHTENGYFSKIIKK